jgi:branched-chain amino acid transport system ATP-binding protein
MDMVPEAAVTASAAADIVLETRELTRRFGGITATDRVSLRIPRGARHALIGPNGAGKTTLINLLTGVLAPTSGRILLDGEDIGRLAAHERVGRGLVRTFQINQLFNGLTPLQSIALAACHAAGLSSRWWRPLGQAAGADVAATCDRLLSSFHLGDVQDLALTHLPYGKRRLLEIAIAIACRPRVLLLDEPVAGVPEGDRQQILDAIGALPADVTVLLIEHDMDLVFSFARTVSVLVNGAVLVEGHAAAIAADARVRAVYLGESHGLAQEVAGPAARADHA